MKRMFLILILFYFQSSYSQNQRTEVIGVIKFDLLPVDNIHVLNLSSRIGTISESNGLFKIDVKDGDSILFSSIQFQKKKLLINQNHLKNGIIYVNLENQIYKLDTVFIKNHNLTGIILVDLKNSPKDNNVKTNFKWEKILNWSTPLTIDKIDLMTPPSVLHLVDPTYSSASGAGATMRDYRYEKDQKLKRELKRKKDFPSDIKTKFGVYFFETNLRIDSININNFLDYCNSEDIIELYYKKEYLKVIEILTKESVKYKK